MSYIAARYSFMRRNLSVPVFFCRFAYKYVTDCEVASEVTVEFDGISDLSCTFNAREEVR